MSKDKCAEVGTGKKKKKEKVKSMDQGLSQIQLAYWTLNIFTRVRSDLSQQRLDLFLVVSVLLSILSLESPQQCLLPYMMMAQFVWTLPFLDKLIANLLSNQTRVQTRALLMGLLGWIALRYTYGYVLVLEESGLLLNLVFLVQSILLVQTMGALLRIDRYYQEDFNFVFPQRLTQLVVGFSVSLPLLVVLVLKIDSVLLPWLLLLWLASLCVVYHVCLYRGNNALWSCYVCQLAILIGCQSHVLLWPHSSSYYPPQPLVMVTLGILALSKGICHTSPGIFLCLASSVVMTCLLPGWTCLTLLVVIPHMWFS